MKMMFPILEYSSTELTKVLNEHVKKNDIVEVKEMMARFTTDVISNCAFGVDANCLKNPNALFREMGRKITEPTLSNAFRMSIALNPTLAKFLNVSLMALE